MTRPREPRQLLNTAEVAMVLGVSRPRVTQLVNARADFPRPYAYTMMGARTLLLWTPAAIDEWNRTADREGGNPSLRNQARELGGAAGP
jgi:predicted DNA-binding transcriptional regulator AlpA